MSAAPAHAQTAEPPATTGSGPGPATQPPPAPGTTQPGPTQAPAAPTPPGTSTDATAPAEPAATPPPNYKIQYNGLVDGYLQYQFSNPNGTLIGPGIRDYDQRIKTPTLALAEVNVFNTPKPGGFAFKTTLIAGDTADINHGVAAGSSSSTGEAQFKNIQQLYGTYNFGVKGGGVDVGKFYTPFGYEVTEASGNYNYSRSLPYFLLPVYHAGLRVYSPSYNGLTLTGYVVNAITNSPLEGVHRRGDVGYIGQANYTDPKGKFVAIATGGYGKVKPADTKIGDTTIDIDGTYNLNANQLVGLNYSYLKFDPDDNSGKTTYNAYAAYYRQALTPKNAFALRFSGFTGKADGADTFRPYEITGTYEYKAAANFTTRLEYRHDNSNLDDLFLGNNDSAATGGSKKSQDTLTIAGLFSF